MEFSGKKLAGSCPIAVFRTPIRLLVFHSTYVVILDVFVVFCKSASNFASLLPVHWQAFAEAVAKFCQSDGKVLPIVWQRLADKEARSCQFYGPVLSSRT